MTHYIAIEEMPGGTVVRGVFESLAAAATELRTKTYANTIILHPVAMNRFDWWNDGRVAVRVFDVYRHENGQVAIGWMDEAKLPDGRVTKTREMCMSDTDGKWKPADVALFSHEIRQRPVRTLFQRLFKLNQEVA